jgi:hypothetical protein
VTGDATTLPANTACADPGRRLFFDHAGRYFAAWPRLQKCPAGTSCDQCGDTSTTVWRTRTGTASCLAQITITRKRGARKAPEEPIVPADAPGRTAFADGHFVVAGPKRTRLITNLVPNAPIPNSVELRWGGPGSIGAARRELLRNPPPPPFVAIVFQKAAGYPIGVTIHPSLIILNGKDACTLSSSRISFLMDVLQGLTWKQVEDLIAMRDRLSSTTPYRNEAERKRDQAKLSEIRAANAISPEQFRRLPRRGSAEATTIRLLLDQPSSTRPTCNASET